MYFISPHQRYTDGNTSNFTVDDSGTTNVTESFRHRLSELQSLGSIRRFETMLLSYLLRFMGLWFGAYEKTNSTDYEVSISAVSVACAMPPFMMPSTIILVQQLFSKAQCHGTDLDSY
jgi:hypothetical protein